MSRDPDGPEHGTGRLELPGEDSGATLIRPLAEHTHTQELVRPATTRSQVNAAEPFALRPGDLLAGRFCIVRFVAQGGMGAVYEAEDLSLRTRVALKIIQSALLADGSALERFRREVLLARRVAHPNVCHVYEFYESRTVDAVPIHFLTMELLDGTTLAHRLRERGRMTPAEALPVVLQMCDGLDAAHAEGVVHRDFKSSNVLLVQRRVRTNDSGSFRAVITDFGIARPLDSPDLGLTGGAGMLGTPEYMAPEQVTGGTVTPATDIYALGVVLYEMVTGQLPFTGDTPFAAAVKRIQESPRPPTTVLPGLDPRWSEVILRGLAREPENRFRTSQEVKTALLGSPEPRRSRRMPFAPAAVLILLAVLATWHVAFRKDERWLRAEILPEIHRLADSDQPMAAQLLAMKAEKELPGNPLLATAWRSFANKVSIDSRPQGARVSFREYDDEKGPWHELGVTPLKDMWFPRDGFYRMRVELPGYVPHEGAVGYWWLTFGVTFPLDRLGVVPEDQVHVPAILTTNGADGNPLGEFLIDRYEVTNRRYKAFVDAGGYQRKELWKVPFVKDGRQLSWEEALAQFTDRTGRPGPSTWELSAFPRGEENHPVSGISWYEAAAFAAFEGRDLPTVRHWILAAGTAGARWMTARSNLGGKGPAPVGQFSGLNRSGAVDMAGNVREWCFNEETRPGGGRFILGGGWNDPTYVFTDLVTQSPWDRSPTNGVRLATYLSSDADLRDALRPVSRPFRDYRKETPATDAEFKIYLRMYAYDRTPLNAKLEQSESTDDWVREKVSFDAGYGKERMIAYLFIPRRATAPFQPVVYFPGSNVLFQKSIDQELTSWDFLVRSGRMLVYPIFRGTLERRTDPPVPEDEETVAYRDFAIQWARDLGRTIDYLETRKDVDVSRIGYFGWSWGGMMGGLYPAVEPRLKAAVLYVAGLGFARPAPEVDPFNFLPRIKIPVLMLNGKLDHDFPMETSQIPMFEGFGTTPENKRQIIYDAGHLVPRSQLIKETLDWYDRYLGPVKTSSTTSGPSQRN